MSKVLKGELFDRLPSVDEQKFRDGLKAALKGFNKKIVVLDDDPTGVQTVNGISVYTDWTAASIAAGFAEDNSMFFILTNSPNVSARRLKTSAKISCLSVAVIRLCAGIIRLKLRPCARRWRLAAWQSTEKF